MNAGVVTGDDADDLLTWLRGLPDCPPVTRALLAGCDRHGDDLATWCYVEADAGAGVARRRCVACGATSALLDSAERWTFPPMFSCRGCSQSLVEVGIGIATAPAGEDGPLDGDVAPDERASWVAVGARCVDCGRIEGLTDAVVAGLPLAEVTSRV